MTPLDQRQDFWKTTELPPIEADENGINALTDGTYCSVKWDDAWSTYNQHVHHPLLLFICILGCVTNVLNLFIFTRSTMQNPINFLLSVLSATDFLCVFRKAIDVSLKFYRHSGVDQRTSYHLHVENWINEICFNLFHTWSIYITLVVALWRLIGILKPMHSRNWLSYKNAKLVAAISIGFATLLVPLLFVGSSVELYNSGPQYDDNQFNLSTEGSDSTTEPFSDENEYFEDESNIDDPDYVLTQTQFGESLQFWIHGLLIKLVPCFVLIVSTILLINALRIIDKNRSALFEDHKNINSHGDGESFDRETTHRTDTVTYAARDKRHSPQATKEFIKTTKMLIVLLTIFLVTELPPGILAFCYGFIKFKKFFLQCYMPIRPFLNLNEYISSSVGFFIYFSMSSKFRQIFIQHFRITNRTNDEDPTFLNILMSKVPLFSKQTNINRKDVSPSTSYEVD